MDFVLATPPVALFRVLRFKNIHPWSGANHCIRKHRNQRFKKHRD